MMSLSMIREVQREAALRAAEDGERPFVYWPGDEPNPGDLPFLGDYVPRGWRLVRTYFVDGTGRGHEDEPAMTIEAWRREVEVVVAEYAGTGRTPGWAVYEAGQFQVYVGLYERDNRAPVKEAA